MGRFSSEKPKRKMPRLHSPYPTGVPLTDIVGRQGAGSFLIKYIKINLLGRRIGWFRVESESEGGRWKESGTAHQEVSEFAVV